MARTVTMIQPARLDQLPFNAMTTKALRRAAGYARVSTDEDEQQSSYEAQVAYYTQQIQQNPEWEFVQVYTDDGISATSTKHRDGFNQMISDALEGKIDLIITKSVSRFARNTVDSLTTIRKLKEVGCECYFEKENIWTFDGKGELLLTIMSSLAQEESRSISENVTWGKRRSCEQGKVSMPYSRFLGYERGDDGIPQVVESEAEVVRLIYTLFLQGRTVNSIARTLTSQGIPTPGGKVKWSVSTVNSILRNEKYSGQAVLQKTFCTDFLTKHMKKNEGEVPQFHVENSHPPIVTPEQYDLVQAELERRQEAGAARQSGVSPFSSRLICEACGAYLGPKTWHSTTAYRSVIWQCNKKYAGASVCKTRHLREDEIQQAFVKAFNSLVCGPQFARVNECEPQFTQQFTADRAALLEGHRALMAELTDASALGEQIAQCIAECEVTEELVRKVIDENARTAIDPAAYEERYNALIERYGAAKAKLEETEREKRARELRKARTAAFFAEVEGREGLLSEFDEQLWCATVECATVLRDGGLRFRFKDGREVDLS